MVDRLIQSSASGTVCVGRAYDSINIRKLLQIQFAINKLNVQKNHSFTI